MRVIDLALKDLRQLARDRQTFIFLLVMPIVFTLLFGFAFGGNQTADPRLPLGLLNQDEDDLGQHLVALLEDSAVVRLQMEADSPAELERLVADETVAAGLVIPASYSEQLRRSEPVAPTFMALSGGSAGFTVQTEVETAVFRLTSAVQAARITVETAAQQNALPGGVTEAAYFDDALTRALAAWDAPPVQVVHTNANALPVPAEEDSPNYSAYAHTSPGMMAQFAIAGLIGAAGILALEKKSRCLQRLVTTNMSPGQILVGHYLAMFVMILLQMAILILFGQLALRLPYFSQPWATLLVTVTAALFCAGLGLLIGVVARDEEQVIVLALVPMFVLAGLGGAWVPLEVTPAAFQRIAMFTPLAWVIDGYKDILVRGLGLEAVTTAAAVLLAYAAGLFGLAVWRFRLD
ncbi:MAG: ABC transporter permease [Chloroflexota bacterium]